MDIYDIIILKQIKHISGMTGKSKQIQNKTNTSHHFLEEFIFKQNFFSFAALQSPNHDKELIKDARYISANDLSAW